MGRCFSCAIEEHDKLKFWAIDNMKSMHNNKSWEKHHNALTKTKQHHGKMRSP